MSAGKAIMTNLELTSQISEAVSTAIKAGMDKADVSAVLARLQEILDNSDD